MLNNKMPCIIGLKQLTMIHVIAIFEDAHKPSFVFLVQGIS